MRTLALGVAAMLVVPATALAQHAGHHDAQSADAAPGETSAEPASGHAAMDHGAMDHGAMDQSPMPSGTGDRDGGMAGMDHAGHAAANAPPADRPGDGAAPAIPADHAADAVFGGAAMAASRDHMREEMTFAGFFAELHKLEYRAGKGRDGYAFAGEASYGGDIDRGVVALSGEGMIGEAAEEIEIDTYWRHAIGPWFNLQLGARHDFRPDPERNYAMIGLQGVLPYWIESEVQSFVSAKGDVHLRGKAAHDMRLLQRLVLEPEVEVDIAMQDVPELGIGSGLDTVELAARLRYEVARDFAPYLGVAWERKLGDSARFARDEGEKASRLNLLAGVRFAF